MRKQIERLETEIRELKRVCILYRDTEKIEALKKEARELENEMMKDLEW